jgi:cytochrome c-type biogenesis protein CcmE
MNPTRKRRLWLVLAVVAAAALATTLIALALQRNVAYLYTPNEVLTGEAGANVTSGEARFRLGGMVAADSLKRTPGTLDARFEVDDGDARLPVVYTGILPDLFREKQAVSPPVACRAACSSPRKCWPSTTRPTCRRKSPTRWAWRTRSTTCPTRKPRRRAPDGVPP